MSSGDVWQRLDDLGPDRVAPGLERVRRLLTELGNPQLTYPTAIVAGTNGKGSTVAMLAAIGGYAGLRVGSYTSPHLSRLEERFRIDGHSISQDGLAIHLDAVLAASDRLGAGVESAESATYFEVLTVAALRYFAEARVDLALLEVGLGGRLDATNVTSPRVAVITSIDLDHADYLGTDLATIADEKFAVVPEGGVAVSAPQNPVVAARLRERAGQRGISLIDSQVFPMELRDEDERGCCQFDMDGRLRTYRGLELSLPGRHQLDNARCAVLAAEALDRRRMRIGSDTIWAGLRNTTLPGRCEWIEGTPATLLDGAHNPAAAARLAEYLGRLRERGAFARLHMVIGVLRDKDMAGIAGHLFPLADTLITTRPPSPRGATASELLATGPVPEQHEAVDDPEAALALALASSGPGDLVCITGSLYLLGHLRPLVNPT